TILEMGGARGAIEAGYMKSALVQSMAERLRKINAGELVVVGMNKWTEGLVSPLLAGDDGGIFSVDRSAVEQTLADLRATREKRDPARAQRAIEALKAAAKSGAGMMEPSIECALARVTTGE